MADYNIFYLRKKKGGLQICSLANLNKALLEKWKWRFAILFLINKEYVY